MHEHLASDFMDAVMRLSLISVYSTVYIQCFTETFMASKYSILVINICQIYMCFGEKWLDVFLVSHIVHIMEMLSS